MEKNNALASGTVIDEYVIDSVLGGGGFSIVYKAHHKETDNPVVIKEYMPQKLAVRIDDCKVVSKSKAEESSLVKGKKLFIQEASSLALLKHENIVNVITFFPANGTNYMVMDEVKGVNLQSYIRKQQGQLSEKLLRIVFVESLKALKVIHEQKMLHLDIKPGNIHLRPGGKPLLLDFGAVRETQESRLYDNKLVATAGFAPIEQVTERGYLGPWTDIYAMGATIRSSIDGRALPPSKERKQDDKLVPAVKAYMNLYSPEFLNIIDWATEVDPEARPQNCDILINEIDNLPDVDSFVPEKPKGLFSQLKNKLFK
ncbi:MAG: serine/threonine protein kinase [Gammaproteobacteria bacterium]|nr:serine/threonine protein kinase [Gammaproteobacteria bacterium]